MCGFLHLSKDFIKMSLIDFYPFLYVIKCVEMIHQHITSDLLSGCVSIQY